MQTRSTRPPSSKHQAPNPKSQTPNPKKIPNSKYSKSQRASGQAPLRFGFWDFLGFGVWDLELLWSLDLGAWSLGRWWYEDAPRHELSSFSQEFFVKSHCGDDEADHGDDVAHPLLLDALTI